MLIHGNRGRRPANRLTEGHRARLVELASTDLAGFDPVLARYLPRHNARFAVPAAEELPAWQAWTLSWPVEAPSCASTTPDGWPTMPPSTGTAAAWRCRGVPMAEPGADAR